MHRVYDFRCGESLDMRPITAGEFVKLIFPGPRSCGIRSSLRVGRYAAAHDAEWLASRSGRGCCRVRRRRSHGSSGCFGSSAAPPISSEHPRYAEPSSDADELALQRRRDARCALAVLAARSTRRPPAPPTPYWPLRRRASQLDVSDCSGCRVSPEISASACGRAGQTASRHSATAFGLPGSDSTRQ